jgi:biotin carboxyl carrier protein
MLKAIVDQSRVFRIETRNGQTLLNDTDPQASIARPDQKEFHVLMKSLSYRVFVLQIDEKNQTMVLSINGKKVQVKLVSQIQDLLKKMGLESDAHDKIDEILAPMPGLIHRIEVEVGQSVAKGDPLLILEAMKMENVIKSPGEGVVRSIHIKEKAAVDKGQLLIRFK